MENGSWEQLRGSDGYFFLVWGAWMYKASDRSCIICSVLLIEFSSIPL